MPARRRAILVDIQEKNLNPKKAHKSIASDGRFRPLGTTTAKNENKASVAPSTPVFETKAVETPKVEETKVEVVKEKVDEEKVTSSSASLSTKKSMKKSMKK